MSIDLLTIDLLTIDSLTNDLLTPNYQLPFISLRHENFNGLPGQYLP